MRRGKKEGKERKRLRMKERERERNKKEQTRANIYGLFVVVVFYDKGLLGTQNLNLLYF